MPAAPKGDHDLTSETIYWGPLLHLLLFRLGWALPALGLQRWRDAGRPADDPTLALVAKVWATDGGLEGFTTWLARDHPSFPGLGALALRDEQARVEAAAEAVRLPSDVEPPYSPAWDVGGGSDPLHLAGHTYGPLTEPPPPLHLWSDRSSRRAVLMLDSMVGWYQALVTFTAGLPSLGDRSWHVDLHVTTVGHLGTYRRSRRTGLWFTGRHRTHTMGMP